MNDRDLKLMCKQIKVFYSLVQWQIVEVQYGSPCINVLQHSITLLGKIISATQLVLKRRKLAIFSLQHTLYLLDTYSKNSDSKIFNCSECRKALDDFLM